MAIHAESAIWPVGINHWGQEIVYGFYAKELTVDVALGLSRSEGAVVLESLSSWPEDKRRSLWKRVWLINEVRCLAARRKISNLMKDPPKWNALGYNCVDFVREVAAEAGVEVPSTTLGSASEVPLALIRRYGPH